MLRLLCADLVCLITAVGHKDIENKAIDRIKLVQEFRHAVVIGDGCLIWQDLRG